MILTEEMQKIMNLIHNDENNVFVTGKAGSGKTTFLKYLTLIPQHYYKIFFLST